MNDYDLLVGVLVGFALSIVVGSFAMKDDMDYINVQKIQESISQCPNSEYDWIDISGDKYGWHDRTVVHCSKEMIVVKEHEHYINRDKVHN